MDDFQKIAEGMVVYRLRSAWLELSRIFNAVAQAYDGTLSMGFVLLAINEDQGTQVTRIAPRLGMEPNSLSRLLKNLEERKLVLRKKDKNDRRKVYICLTEEGKKMREVALKTVFQMEKSIVKNIPKDKLAAFFEVMEMVPEGIEGFRSQLSTANQ